MSRTREDILEEIESLQKVLRALRRRRYVLDEQAAKEGIQARPQVITEIESIDEQIKNREESISRLADFLLDENIIISTDSNIIEIPEELKLDFVKRRAILSEGQSKILYYIERSGYNHSYISQDILENTFNQYSKTEVFYRLEQLRLLGFIEREIIKQGNSDSAMYRLSRTYHKKLGNFMKYALTHGDLHASNILKEPNNWIIDFDAAPPDDDSNSPKR